MTITIISDASDNNSFLRTGSRAASLFNAPVIPVGVEDYAELEAAGNLIEAIDALEEREGIILVNSAPRHGKGKKWKNGTPFGYFRYKNILVVSTIDGATLSLAKQFNLIDELYITDLPKVINFAIENSLMKKALGDYVINSQFRSYDYQPKLAYWLYKGLAIPSEKFDLNKIEEITNKVWWIDNFGNIKTTLTGPELEINQDGKVKTQFGTFNFYNALKDVPDKTTAVINGSSGLQGHKFIELVMQGGRFADKFNVNVGDTVI